ncbi:MAG TPA: anthranilate synthase component I, partial [Candidatus Angelobacter sp.]|nr:anthranilate synthase component I [Candidatus Angelobacter sp.]
MRELKYSTQSGIAVTRVASKVPYKNGLKRLLKDLDSHRGVYLSSGYEFPGRYSRWDFASARPPLEIIAIDREVEFRPLNQRGEMMNRMLLPVLARNPHWESF